MCIRCLCWCGFNIYIYIIKSLLPTNKQLHTSVPQKRDEWIRTNPTSTWPRPPSYIEVIHINRDCGWLFVGNMGGSTPKRPRDLNKTNGRTQIMSSLCHQSPLILYMSNAALCTFAHKPFHLQSNIFSLFI